MTPISNDMAYLVVEDDEPKLGAVISAIREVDEFTPILTAGSVASALNIISERPIAFAVIDLSLPAYDFATDMSGGGQPQDSGGRDILRFLEEEQSNAKAVVLTQYEEINLEQSFAATPKKLENIKTELNSEFGGLLCDVIFYAGQRGAWRESLKTIISRLKEEE